MANVKELLKIRHDVKKRKPDFQRQDINKKKRLSNNPGWRAPKGAQSKMRLGNRGHPSKVNVGYGSPSKAKGLLRNGLAICIISNVSELEKIDKKTHVCVISSQVGTKKRLDIIKKAKALGVIVYNYKDADAFVKSAIEEIEKRKKIRLERKTKKKESAKKAEKAEKSDKSDKNDDSKVKNSEDTKNPKTSKSHEAKKASDSSSSKPSSKEASEDEKDKEKKDWDKLLTQKG
jgi:ribosomal protein L32E